MTRLSKISSLVLALAGAGVLAGVAYRNGWTGQISGPGRPDQGAAGPLFSKTEAELALTADGQGGEGRLDLGRLPLGGMRELVLKLTFPAGGTGNTLREAESSCSCLQPLGWPEPAADGKGATLRARYLAVRPGPVDVTLAVSRVDAAGREEILMARVTGTVQEGDLALADRLSDMVKDPVPPAGRAGVTEGVVQPEEVRAAVESGTGVVVDIRPVEEFTGSHIEGALNIPLSTLRPSGAFRGRAVYLTGTPLVTAALRDAREGLLRQGMEGVFVLNGGVAGWRAAGGRTVEEMDPPPVIQRISAQEAHGSALDPMVRVLSADPGTDEFAFRYFFPNGEIVSGLESAVEERLKADPAARVIIAEAADRYAGRNHAAPPHWLGRVFYLRGGVTGHRAEMEKLATMAAHVPGSQSGSARGFAGRQPGQRVGVPAGPGCATCPKRNG